MKILLASGWLILAAVVIFALTVLRQGARPQDSVYHLLRTNDSLSVPAEKFVADRS